MLDRRSYILLICGLAGIIAYFYLRPNVDINAGGPITEDRATVEERVLNLAPKLGFSVDSLAMMTVRAQHTGYIKTLLDTVESDVSLSHLNENEIHIQSWKTIIGSRIMKQDVIAGENHLYNSVGQLKLHISNSGKLVRLQSHPENNNPTFLRGDSLQVIAENLVGTVFGYDLNNYEMVANPFSGDSAVENMPTSSGIMNANGNESLEISWKKITGEPGPSILQLKLNPVVREFDSEESFRTEFGFNIQSFIAKDEYEPDDFDAPASGGESSWFNYLFFISVVVLGVLVFAVGIRNIFKGKAEWRRALIVFAVISLGFYGWRTIFMMYSYNPFLGNAAMFSTVANNVIFALSLGLYAALAYINWEALARDQHQKQMDIIDALWQRKVFICETGAGVVHGFAIGGIAIGLFSVIAYMMGEFIVQSDSQFGFTEASISPKLFTLNLSAWTTTWLVSVAQIGFVYAILNQWIKRKWLVGLLSIFMIASFTAVLGRLVGTSADVFGDLLLYFSLAVIFVYTLREYGLFSVCMGWWFFAIFFMIQPYWESPDISVAYVGWAEGMLMLGLLAFGFVAYKYGAPVSEVGHYIPEYEERIAQHLRVEKEIEIARESQYKLMPLQPPQADGIDVHGFFLPSFEVGGDYFDYVVSEDEHGKPAALTMAVVDVSGKAMRAAMPAIFTSGLLLSRMKFDMPDKILSQVAEPIYLRTDKRTFITCVLARYDFITQKIAVANAGHCRPILKRNGIAEFIQTPDPKYPLGLKPDVVYKSQEITLKKGDFFLLYSDGLPEAANEKGARFGFDEVPRLIEQIDTDNLTSQEISQEIKRTVQKFSNYQLVDDTTIICLKV